MIFITKLTKPSKPFLGRRKPANRRLSGGETVVEPLTLLFCFASFEGFVT